MSLINDALKRASQTSKDRPAQASLSAPMEPVRQPARPKSRFIFVAVPAVVAILGLAGWFFVQWYHQRRAHHARPPVTAANAAQKPTVVPKGPVANTVSPPRPAGGATPPGQSAVATSMPASAPTAAAGVRTAAASQSVSTATVPQQNSSLTGTRSPQPTVVTPAPVPPPAPATPVPLPRYVGQPAVPFPKMHVKAIFYNRNRPYALINGETVTEGEHVVGVRVVKILPDKVTMEMNGFFKQLILGE